MISTNDIRPGMALDLPEGLFQIVDWEHVKPGKGRAFVRMRIKNLETGQVLDKTFRADEDVNRAIIERKDHQYLYRDDLGLHFMDLESFGQFAMSAAEDGGDVRNYLTEGMTAVLAMHKGGRSGSSCLLRSSSRWSRRARESRATGCPGRPSRSRCRPGWWSRCRSSSSRGTPSGWTPAAAGT